MGSLRVYTRTPLALHRSLPFNFSINPVIYGERPGEGSLYVFVIYSENPTKPRLLRWNWVHENQTSRVDFRGDTSALPGLFTKAFNHHRPRFELCSMVGNKEWRRNMRYNEDEWNTYVEDHDEDDFNASDTSPISFWIFRAPRVHDEPNIGFFNTITEHLANYYKENGSTQQEENQSECIRPRTCPNCYQKLPTTESITAADRLELSRGLASLIYKPLSLIRRWKQVSCPNFPLRPPC